MVRRGSRYARLLFAAVIAVMLLGLLAGCGKSPEQERAEVAEKFFEAVNAGNIKSAKAVTDGDLLKQIKSNPELFQTLKVPVEVKYSEPKWKDGKLTVTAKPEGQSESKCVFTASKTNVVLTIDKSSKLKFTMKDADGWKVVDMNFGSDSLVDAMKAYASQDSSGTTGAETTPSATTTGTK